MRAAAKILPEQYSYKSSSSGKDWNTSQVKREEALATE
jgi:hypothetical protein